MSTSSIRILAVIFLLFLIFPALSLVFTVFGAIIGGIFTAVSAIFGAFFSVIGVFLSSKFLWFILLIAAVIFIIRRG